MIQPVSTLADNLRSIREKRSLSLDKLSEMTGVSKSMLRQIEIDQSSPTIATIWKIANGLRVPFTALLKKEAQKTTLRAFKEGTPLTGDSRGYRLYPLIEFSPERSFELYYVEIEPQAALGADPHQGNAEEHVFVLKGQIEITVESEIHRVVSESFISFQANHAHRYRNPGDKKAAAIMLISYMP
jgi:transcriptional regulator with XRE-family HTH domain